MTDRHPYRSSLKATFPPVADDAPRPSRSVKDAIQRLDDEALKLSEHIRRIPFHGTIQELAERMR
jgi:hypothetical protein